MKFSPAILHRLATPGIVAGFSVDNPRHAVPLARALLEGGITAIELTLRTEAGIEAARQICSSVPEMLVGVGTILTPEQVHEVKEAGAAFGVAPGLNPRVVQAAEDRELPFAPGIATPSELEQAIERGCGLVKFFPAEAIGGLSYLRSMVAPYRHLGIQYFPLGGINEENFREYLADPDIPAVGGTWIVSQEMVKREEWELISARATNFVGQLNINELMESKES